MKRIKLTRPVFLFIHELVLSQFQYECETEWGFDKLEKYQIYGYSTLYDQNKPNLPKFIRKNKRVMAYLDQIKEKKGKVHEISGQYLYSRFLKVKTNPHGPPITLAGIYADIFLLYIGYEDLLSLLKEVSKKNREIDEKQSDELKQLSDEDLMVQNLLIGNSHSISEKNKYISSYGLYFYSKLRERIYIIKVKIDYTPGLAKIEKTKYRTFAANGKEILPPEENQPKTYKGIATFKKNKFSVDFESTDEKEDFHISLAAVTNIYEEFKKHKDLKGCYLSHSRNGEIISGRVIMHKLAEGEDVTAIPRPIWQYLISEKAQVRVKQKKVTTEILDSVRTASGYGGILDSMLNKHFRVFVLDLSRENLVEMALEIKDDYTYIMQIYDKDNPKVESYKGGVFIKSTSLLIFDSTAFETYSTNKKPFINMAFLEVSDFKENQLNPMEGKFVWSNRAGADKENKNAMILGEMFYMVWNKDKEAKSEPIKYLKGDFHLQEELTNEIYKKLKRDAKLRQKQLNTPSVWEQESPHKSLPIH